MKWFKFVIGAILAISVVPLVVLSYLNISKSLKLNEVIFIKEVMEPSDIGDYYLYTFPTPSSVNDIYEFIVNNDIYIYKPLKKE